jgi:hypothetical protein
MEQNPSDFPQLKNLEWIQTDFSDQAELVKILEGVNTVLCFFAVHLDPASENQKRLINAAIEAGVKRFAPSEWGPSVLLTKIIRKVLTNSRGVKLEDSLDALSWYSGKIEVAKYLEEVNAKEKVTEP